jgi:transcriptional regulator with XRE-family HTH domain
MDRRGLADFLRGRRERIRPEDVGLPRGTRRRTPGLRREEVAQLAHISTDHYSRLEQARGRHPSRQVLQAIARALRLTDQERAHLFSLAGEREQHPARTPARRIDPATSALLDRLADTPALVMDSTCRLLAWNAPAAALFGDPTALQATDRNVLRRYFLGPPRHGPGPGGYGVTDHQRFVRTAVGYLRIAATRYPDDPDTRALVADLLAASPDFADAWHSQQLSVDHHARLAYDHPEAGAMELDFDVLSLPDRDQHMVLFTAEPGSSADLGLRLLLAPTATGAR